MLFFVLGCTEPTAGTPTLDEAFQLAADAHGVPKDLLVAVSYSMTRFDDPLEGDHEHGGMRGLGVMDIGAGSPASGPELARGAGRLGIDLEEATHDRAANIAIAASELRWRADQLEAETGTRIDRIEDWVEVVGWYSGSTDGDAQRSFARQIYRFIEGGLHARDPVDGRWISVAPREVDLPMLSMQSVSVGSGDSSLNDNVVAAASCNYASASRGAGDIDMIVVHTAQGSYSGTYNWFQNCSAQASAHYVIRSSDGEITQMVGEGDTAWHAGHSATNSRSVSIELEGYVEDPARWFTDAMYQSLAALVKDVASRQGVTLDRAQLIGHMEVPGCAYSGGGGRSCHTDPGTGFDWSRLMSLVGTTSSEPPPTSSASGTGDLVGYVRQDSIYNSSSPVVGAAIAVSSGQSATTDSRGYYRVEDVPAGVVTLSVSAGGFSTATDTADIAAGMTNWNSVAVVAGSSSSSSSSSSSGTAVPTDTSPTGWSYVAGPEANLSWTGTGASSYEVKIYWHDGSDWNDYYTYTTTGASKTFWPSVDGTYYAWVVRSVGGSGTSEWSGMNYFEFGAG